MSPIIDLKMQWQDVCVTLRKQLIYLEEGRVVYPLTGDPKQFTRDLIADLRVDIAVYERLLTSFKFATFEGNCENHGRYGRAAPKDVW
jgi:hypothetical protein